MNKILKSGSGGALTSFIYFYLALKLDKNYNTKLANIIALIVSIILNFIVQCNVFLTSSSIILERHCYKFLLIVFIVLIINQQLFDYLIDNKEKYINLIPVKFQKYYNTIARMIINSTLFIFIGYPSRVYWIFK